MAIVRRNCAACERTFETDNPRRRFCGRDNCPGGKYQKVDKTEVICCNCFCVFETSKRNQQYCSKYECQKARNRKNLNDHILRKAKELTNAK